jgi:hypothetical protein
MWSRLLLRWERACRSGGQRRTISMLRVGVRLGPEALKMLVETLILLIQLTPAPRTRGP